MLGSCFIKAPVVTARSREVAIACFLVVTPANLFGKEYLINDVDHPVAAHDI